MSARHRCDCWIPDRMGLGPDRPDDQCDQCGGEGWFWLDDNELPGMWETADFMGGEGES